MMQLLRKTLILFLLLNCTASASILHDGVDDTAGCGSAAGIDNFTLITITAWVNHGTVTGNQEFIDKRDWATTFNGWSFTIDGTNDRLFWNWEPATSGGLGSWRTATDTLTPSVWHHVAVTYDSTATTNDPILYIDGVSKTVTEASAPGNATPDDAGSTFTVGHMSNAAFDFYDGYVEDICYANAIATAAQIAAMAASQMRSMCWQLLSPKVYLPINEGPVGTSADGAIYHDLSGNGNNCTGNNGANNTGLTWATSILNLPQGIQ